ncbi:MAG: alanine racemase [Ruthenibacterium lactatiformans]
MFSLEYARALEAALRAAWRCACIESDTGMGRIGPGGRRYGACRGGDRGLCLPGLCPGVFTHFAAADSTAPRISYTRRQYDILCAAVEEMAARAVLR